MSAWIWDDNGGHDHFVTSHNMTWMESDLLSFGKVVIDVAVQDHLAKLSDRHQ